MDQKVRFEKLKMAIYVDKQTWEQAKIVQSLKMSDPSADQTEPSLKQQWTMTFEGELKKLVIPEEDNKHKKHHPAALPRTPVQEGCRKPIRQIRILLRMVRVLVVKRIAENPRVPFRCCGGFLN
jgi:hypothetical protein